MPWVLDGNNVARGEGRECVREAALALARTQRLRIVAFFDGAPPAGSPPIERLGAVEVHYVPNADEAILALLRQGGRGWVLASDDRALARQALACGAKVVTARAFWATVARARAASTEREELQQGQLDLGRTERLPDRPSRVRRLPRARRRW